MPAVASPLASIRALWFPIALCTILWAGYAMRSAPLRALLLSTLR